MNKEDIDSVIEMAWDDRKSFEATKAQFALTEDDVVILMRRDLKRSSFNLWRKRVHNGISQNTQISCFKFSKQKSISMNKISKR